MQGLFSSKILFPWKAKCPRQNKVIVSCSVYLCIIVKGMSSNHHWITHLCIIQPLLLPHSILSLSIGRTVDFCYSPKSPISKSSYKYYNHNNVKYLYIARESDLWLLTINTLTTKVKRKDYYYCFDVEKNDDASFCTTLFYFCNTDLQYLLSVCSSINMK